MLRTNSRRATDTTHRLDCQASHGPGRGPGGSETGTNPPTSHGGRAGGSRRLDPNRAPAAAARLHAPDSSHAPKTVRRSGPGPIAPPSCGLGSGTGPQGSRTGPQDRAARITRPAARPAATPSPRPIHRVGPGPRWLAPSFSAGARRAGGRRHRAREALLGRPEAGSGCMGGRQAGPASHRGSSPRAIPSRCPSRCPSRGADLARGRRQGPATGRCASGM